MLPGDFRQDPHLDRRLSALVAAEMKQKYFTSWNSADL